MVELRRATALAVDRWEVGPVGEAVRVLAWLGPDKGRGSAEGLEAEDAARRLRRLVAAPQLPTWLTRQRGKAAYG